MTDEQVREIYGTDVCAYSYPSKNTMVMRVFSRMKRQA